MSRLSRGRNLLRVQLQRPAAIGASTCVDLQQPYDPFSSCE
jgi:hypothetical protein